MGKGRVIGMAAETPAPEVESEAATPTEEVEAPEVPKEENPGPKEEPKPEEKKDEEKAEEINNVFDAIDMATQQLGQALKTSIAEIIASNYEGRRWVPYVDEAKEAFVERARKKEPNFQFDQWAEAHLGDLRQELPQNFKGPGW